jgi:hypothetical protein
MLNSIILGLCWFALCVNAYEDYTSKLIFSWNLCVQPLTPMMMIWTKCFSWGPYCWEGACMGFVLFWFLDTIIHIILPKLNIFSCCDKAWQIYIVNLLIIINMINNHFLQIMVIGSLECSHVVVLHHFGFSIKVHTLQLSIIFS